MIKKLWRDLIYLAIITVISLTLGHQCNRNKDLNKEVFRLENNIYAMSDTLKQYKDDKGKTIAERRAFILNQKELEETVDLLKTKNREYLTYINTNIGIRDTVEIPTYIEREISNEDKEQGTITIDRNNVYGKSSNELHISIPYTYTDSLVTSPAKVDLTQDIWVEGMIERDKKTGETFVRLVSDYPNMIFNSGLGIVVEDNYNYEKRNTKSVGLSVGPSIGLSYDILNRRIVPTVGIGLTFGFNYRLK